MVQAATEAILAKAFLLLGAGASADAGVPTALAFLDVIRGNLDRYPETEKASLLKAHDRVCRLIEKNEGERAGLEPYYEAIDDCLDAHFQGLRRPGGLKASRAFERLLYEVKRIIQRQCDVKDVARVNYLTPLLADLRRHGSYPIASFNYDSVVETACTSARVSFGEAVLGEPAEQRDIELIKVHGSVTWLPAGEGRLGRSNRFGVDAIWRFRELRTPTLETPLIYPSRRKMPIHDPFMRNAIRLQALLADPCREACVAVGYSFPDMHAREWLSAAMRTRPELVLYLVGPDPAQAISNLTRNLPIVDWTHRLKIVPRTFRQAIESDGGFESALKRAKPFGDLAEAMGIRPPQSRPVVLRGVRVSGLAAGPDGRSIYASDGSRGAILKADLGTHSVTILADGLKDPRGISVTADGRVRVVQNRLLRLKRIPTAGAGTVVEIGADGRRRLLTRPRLSELRAIPRLLKGEGYSSDLWSALPSVLRWPTDIASTADGSAFITQAKTLTALRSSSTPPEIIASPDLAFNFHGLDAADDGALVGVEQGIGQEASWGRVIRFEINRRPVRYRLSRAIEGQTRLMGICFVSSRRKVVVTQQLTWPHGALLVLDYPSLDNLRVLKGFDFPQKIAYLPGRELLAVSVTAGVELMPVAALDDAIPV